ncbi:hypothetical protein [Photobacterium damselae]|uniref:hypothetical protein n=1 Tax=Photobacterium damselae TaxID=38293 RepID=UPI00406939BA
MLTAKDHSTLISKVNKKFSEMECRVRIENATPAMIEFYRANASKINANVVVLESDDDDSQAAKIRNSGESALFVFADSYSIYGVPSYFSGTTNLIEFPKALIKRSLQK